MLLPEVAGPKNAPAGALIRDAVASIDLMPAQVIVVASPHGTRSGVYAAAKGNLDAFGVRGIEVAAPSDEGIAAELAVAWGKPLLDEPADYGVVVPLRLLETPVPVVAVSTDDGRGLADAVASLPLGVAFVASANLSPGLGGRAPLPSLPGAREVDESVLWALREDPATLAALGDRLRAAASCAAAPLVAFGRLFPAGFFDVIAYAHPFGVGYAVAARRR